MFAEFVKKQHNKDSMAQLKPPGEKTQRLEIHINLGHKRSTQLAHKSDVNSEHPTYSLFGLFENLRQII
jgi:hypothetical protein